MARLANFGRCRVCKTGTVLRVEFVDKRIKAQIGRCDVCCHKFERKNGGQLYDVTISTTDWDREQEEKWESAIKN